MYTSMSVNGSVAEGYSSGEAIQAIREVAAETLPQGYGFEFSGMSREGGKHRYQYNRIDLRALYGLCLSAFECTV